MYTSGVWGFSSANEQKNVMKCGELGWRLTDFSATSILNILLLYPLLLCSYPANFTPCFLFNVCFFKKMNPPSHTFSILDIAFRISFSHVTLRSHRCEANNIWSLEIVPTFSRLNSVFNLQCGQRK